LEALFFWALAMYGAMIVIYQSVRRIQRRSVRNPHPLTIILIVNDAETYIEGTLRRLLLETVFTRRERRILVIDVASEDDTGPIVQRLTSVHSCIGYARVQNDAQFVQQVTELYLESPQVGCIYDLRIQGMDREVLRDIAWLCHP